MRHLVAQEGLGDGIEVDSAGTGDWHVGDPPDRRAARWARRAASRCRARRASSRRRTSRATITSSRWTARTGTSCCAWRGTPADRGKVRLLRSFDASAPPDADVPDPYYGGPGGFDEVFDICERACRGLLDHLRRAHGA